MSAPVAARLLYNPRAAFGRGVDRIEPLARDAGLTPVRTADAEEMTEQASRSVERGEERLLVAGGDGALHHAIQGLAGSACVLGIVPTGTGNDLARVLGVPLDPAAAIERALRGCPRRIDLGRVGERYYAGVAGLGLDGEVNRRLAASGGRMPGPVAYAWATLRSLYGFQPPEVRAETEAGPLVRTALIAAVANSPCFGGGMRIAPRARLDDGRLDLIVVERIPIVRLLFLFPRVYRGTHVEHPAVHGETLCRTRLSCLRELTLYADGEPICEVSTEGVEIAVRPGALWVV